MSRGLKKSTWTRTIKTSCELLAGAGKFQPVTRKNRRQSVPAEIFACIRRYFYLRISLPAAFAGNFARASFTVYATLIWKANFTKIRKCYLINYFFPIYSTEKNSVRKDLELLRFIMVEDNLYRIGLAARNLIERKFQRIERRHKSSQFSLFHIIRRPVV